jgi:hypothetical protein
VFALLFTGTLWATNLENLYEAQIPVAGQGAAERAKAVETAFRQVVVKITGNRKLASADALQKSFNRANRYVQQYRYHSLKTPKQPQQAEEGKIMPDRLLWVRFDERAVNQLLRRLEVPVWGKTRPSTLIWLGIESGGKRTLYQPEWEPGLGKAIKRTAWRRGLPILFPLMDMQDRSNLQASDVWGGFEEDIRKASDRYLPDVILVGRLTRVGQGNWLASWTLYQPDKSSSWSQRGAAKEKLAMLGLHEAVDRLAVRFAPRTTGQGVTNLRIRVVDLKRLEQYVLVRDYLQSLAMIEQLDLLSAEPESLSFLARVQGGKEVLEKNIMLGGVLEPASSRILPMNPDRPANDEMNTQRLDYRIR